MLIDKAVETAPQTQQTENGQTESAIKPVSETAPITVDFERLQEENKDIMRRYSLEELEKMCPKDKRLFARLKKLKAIYG